ncbi:MAG: prolipoprotein diacylglyceryl transferase, partial [Planctomycetes bacterium]|nr:prolipoprotein diacylglyceryl transferase [Planctomycetota bacterium]
MLPELWTVPGTEWSIKSYGFLMMVGFLSSVYLAMRRAANVKCDPDVVLNCSFISLVTGIVGARIFYVVHYWDQSFSYIPNPLWAAVNISSGGLEIYGGLIAAIIVVPLYLAVTKRSIRLYLEILAIATMWALGVARIGCFLNGCCFGGVCADANGQANNAWAVQFPFASPALVRQWQERRITLPAELITDNYGRGGGQQLEAFPLNREMLGMSPEKRSKPYRRFETAEEPYQ